jgi:hypothetical protein
MHSRQHYGTALLALTLISGCAQERDPIDRTQPNSYDKSYFSDAWYYQRTVVGVPAANGFTFVGGTDFSGLERVTWDVQERFLFARREYELIKGADSKDENEAAGDVYEGEVVAAFPITSHFDITYAYNTVSGERMNVLEENSWDRPWYERQYIRVDWSQNMVHNYDLDFEAASVEPVPYFVQEYDDATGERHPDAPRFDPNYFDVTNKLFARAGTVDYPPYGEIPLCWLDEFMECGAGEYTLRHSFMRVDPTHQYEPFEYKGKATEVFGYFWNDRPVYSEEGVYTQNLERYLNRHNLWKRSFDADGNPIPYADRELKPVVYHVNREWPSDDAALNDAARAVEAMWNDAFRDAVAATGYPLGADEKVYIFCPNNPVKAGDDPACGDVGLSPRLGDMRYSFMAKVPDYMTYGLLGLGPSNADPLTGEIFSGMAYVYHWNDVGAVRTLDMIDLLNGDKDPEAYIGGVDLTDWVQKTNSSASSMTRTFPLSEANHMVERVANSWKAQIWDGRRYQITAEDEALQQELGARAWMQPHLERLYQEGHLTSHGDHGRAKLSRLVGTEIEDMMLTDEVFMATGLDPRAPRDEDALARASVLRGGFGKFMKEREKFLDDFAATRNCAYRPAMADDALMGLAREFKDKNLTREQKLYELRRRIYTAVLAHEVGHSLGLMHNFGGSDDAINYFDEYWAIRTNDGSVLPRTQDPITDYEVDNKIYNYAYSSVMDYAGRYTIDGAGIGKYDRAAILFGYAEKVEVFKDAHTIPNGTFADWYNNDGDIVLFYGSGPEAVHYTYYYDMMGDDLYAASNRELVDVVNMKADFSEEAGRDARPRVPYIYCSHSRSNLGDSCLTRDFGADATERMQNILDELSTWYIQRNFPRGDRHVDNWNYVSRYYGRVYHRMKSWHDIYGLYADFLPIFYTPQEIQTFFTDDIGGWGTKTWAVQNAYNYLIQTILMPDINDYQLERQADGKNLYRVSAFGGGPITLDVTNARYFSTSWFPPDDQSRECGYMFWECLHHVGFYLDKIMAIEAMSDSETNFVGRSTPEDVREWEISYYSTFPDQIAKLNTAIMGQDWARVGPYWENGELKFPNYTGPLDVTHAQPIDPFATFTIQLYWQVLGRARFPNNYDVSFTEQSRIWIAGTGGAPTLPADRLVEYVDPMSGLTFQAATYSGTGGGEQLIARANAMKARSDYCDNTAETTVTSDDCVTLESGLTKARATSSLMNWTEVLKTMARVDWQMEWGDPYNP